MWNFHMSLCFGTSFDEFLFIEPWSNSMIKCLSHNQLKMIPKNVKNHSSVLLESHHFVRILELMSRLFRTPHVLITWVSAYEKGTFRLKKLQDNRKKSICFITVKGEIKNSLLLVQIQEFTTSIVQWTPYTYISSFGLSNKFSIFQIDKLKET